MNDDHTTRSHAAIKAAVLTVWNSPEFDNATDDEGAGMVADAVLALGRMTPDRAATNDLLRERICEILAYTQDVAPLSSENVDRAVQHILEAVDEHI